jgi:hypothetical protein
MLAYLNTVLDSSPEEVKTRTALVQPVSAIKAFAGAPLFAGIVPYSAKYDVAYVAFDAKRPDFVGSDVHGAFTALSVAAFDVRLARTAKLGRCGVLITSLDTKRKISLHLPGAKLASGAATKEMDEAFITDANFASSGIEELIIAEAATFADRRKPGPYLKGVIIARVPKTLADTGDRLKAMLSPMCAGMVSYNERLFKPVDLMRQGSIEADRQAVFTYLTGDGRRRSTSGPVTYANVPFLVTAAEVASLATSTQIRLCRRSPLSLYGLPGGEGPPLSIKAGQQTADRANARTACAMKRLTPVFPPWNTDGTKMGAQHAMAAGWYASMGAWSSNGNVAGGWKLWTVPPPGARSENHGFLSGELVRAYEKKGVPFKPEAIDSLLIQRRGHVHDAGHYDYSQVLEPEEPCE